MPKPITINVRDFRGVWVFIEHTSGKAASVSWELLTPGRQLANMLGVELGVVIIGESGSRLATEAFAYGADIAYMVDGPGFRNYRTEPYTRALVHLVRHFRPEILLFGETVNGCDLAAAAAVELQTGVAANCTQFSIDLGKRQLEMTRPAYGGGMLATVLCEHHRPQMATVRPRVMPVPERHPGRAGRIVREEFRLKEEELATKVLQHLPSETARTGIAEAEIIVAAGRGIGSAEHMRLVRELADTLGGVVGASRAAVDLGWATPAQQIGQTGSIVRPRLYVAVGISGARQHLVGMEQAETIIAINTDAEAPIFSVATLGIVGDLFTVVPALVRQVKVARSQKAVKV